MARGKKLEIDFYLPPEGLQGQDVPCHLLWSGVEWTAIELEFPDTLELVEKFNTKPGYIKLGPGKLSVFALERDGYLGLVFRSKRVSDLTTKSEVKLAMIHKAKVLFSATRKIVLFRPSLKLLTSPKSITLDNKGNPSARLELGHLGFGTLLVMIDSAEESELKSTVPEQLRKAFEGFASDFEKRLEELETKYPQYAGFFNLAKSLDYSNREEALAKLTERESDVLTDREFFQDIGNALVAAVLKNTDFELLVVRPIVDFIKSAIGRGIIFTTPFVEIECKTRPSKLVLEVRCTDLLGAELLKFKTPAIQVESQNDQRIPVGSIIRWSSRADEVM